MAKQEKTAAELYREERKARIAKAAKKLYATVKTTAPNSFKEFARMQYLKILTVQAHRKSEMVRSQVFVLQILSFMLRRTLSDTQ